MSKGYAAATFVAHLDFPPLRIEKTATSGSLKSSCVLEQNSIYVKYIVPKGLTRIKWVSRV
jgi:hypothetical protein